MHLEKLRETILGKTLYTQCKQEEGKISETQLHERLTHLQQDGLFLDCDVKDIARICSFKDTPDDSNVCIQHLRNKHRSIERDYNEYEGGKQYARSIKLNKRDSNYHKALLEHTPLDANIAHMIEDFGYEWKEEYNEKRHPYLDEILFSRKIKYLTRFGEKNGPYTEYIKGKLQIEGNYKDDMRHGEWKFFYDNGQLRIHTFYKNGLLDGEHLFFNHDGKLLSRSHYKDGKQEGEQIKYDKNGNIESRVFYKNDKPVVE